MRFPSMSKEFFEQLKKQNKNLNGMDREFTKHPIMFIVGIVGILAIECYVLFWVLS